MAAFSYKAMTKDGRRVDGTVQADDRRGALAAVRKLGHTPLSVSEAGGGGAVARKTATTKKKSALKTASSSSDSFWRTNG